MTLGVQQAVHCEARAVAEDTAAGGANRGGLVRVRSASLGSVTGRKLGAMKGGREGAP